MDARARAAVDDALPRVTHGEPPTYAEMTANGRTSVPENTPHDAPHHIPAPGEPSVPELEEDENIPPRPEEEVADVLRARPDVEDHSLQPE